MILDTFNQNDEEPMKKIITIYKDNTIRKQSLNSSDNDKQNAMQRVLKIKWRNTHILKRIVSKKYAMVAILSSSIWIDSLTKC